MRIWSFQPQSVAELLENGQSFVPDASLSSFYSLDDQFTRAYDWLMELMSESIPRPKQATIPVWGWRRNYGELTKPDRRRGLFRGSDDRDVILELEVPDSQVFLTDFDDWHCVLNDYPVFTEQEEQHWPNGYDEWEIPIYDEQFKLESWKRIANDDGDFTQACVWTVEPQHVVKCHKFRSRK